MQEGKVKFTVGLSNASCMWSEC